MPDSAAETGVPSPDRNLGRLISVHEVAPAAMHRAVAVAVLSFVFFLAMLVAFYLRGQFGYFLLSSAFLVLYLFTMVGVLMQKRGTVRIYENGISYKKFSALWGEIKRVKADAKSGITIAKDKGIAVTLPRSISGAGEIVDAIRKNLEQGT